MLRGVARRRQSHQVQSAEVHLLAVGQPAMGMLEVGGDGGDHLGTPSGQLPAAGDEIGVQVGLERDGDAAGLASPPRPGTARGPSTGSTTMARPSPRSTT